MKINPGQRRAGVSVVLITCLVHLTQLPIAAAQIGQAPVARILCESGGSAPCTTAGLWALADNINVLFASAGASLETGGWYIQPLAGGPARRVGPFIREPFGYGVASSGNRVAIVGVWLGSGAVTPELWLFDSSQANPQVRQIPLTQGGELIGLSPSGQWLYYRVPGGGAQQLWRVLMSGAGDPEPIAYTVPAQSTLSSIGSQFPGHLILYFADGGMSLIRPTSVVFDLDQTPQVRELGTFGSAQVTVDDLGRSYAVFYSQSEVLYTLALTPTTTSPIPLSRSDRRTRDFLVAGGQVLFGSRPLADQFPFAEYLARVGETATSAMTITETMTGTPYGVLSTSFVGESGIRILRREADCTHSGCPPGSLYDPANLGAGPLALPATWRDLRLDPTERWFIFRDGSGLFSVPISNPLSQPVALNDGASPVGGLSGLELIAFEPKRGDVLYSDANGKFYFVPSAGPLSQRAAVVGETDFAYNMMGNYQFTGDGRYFVHAALRRGGVSSPLIVIDLAPPAPPTPTATLTSQPSPTPAGTPMPPGSRVYLPLVRK